MKSVFVLAAVALCTLAFELPPLPKLPKAGVRDPKVFVPAALDCYYNIHWSSKMSDISTDAEVELDGKEKRYGRNMLGVRKMDYNGTKVEMSTLLRADIKDKEGNAAIFKFFKLDDSDYYSCEILDYVDLSNFSYDRISGIHGIVTLDAVPYDTMVKDYDWNGEKVDAYYFEYLGYNYTYFADSDDHIVGFIYDTSLTYMEYSFEYKDEVEKKDFKISDKYAGCSAEKKVYDKPADEPDCDLDGSGKKSGSSASTVKAAAVAVAMVMVAALL